VRGFLQLSTPRPGYPDSGLPEEIANFEDATVAVELRIKTSDKAIAFHDRQYVIAVLTFRRGDERFESVVEGKKSGKARTIPKDGIERAKQTYSVRNVR
jgi:hypothetical protein